MTLRDTEPTAELTVSMRRLIEDLYPICRSITGDGVRRSLARMSEVVPIEISEVPSGTPVFDWAVPDEWNIEAAWIEGPDGEHVVDFADHTLHLLNYSAPVRDGFSRSELEQHLYSLPEQPELIPYRTSYYQRRWGFCLPHALRERLPEGTYRVEIDASLEPGFLTYGECVLPGERGDEVLLSCHVCHPSLANDNLSGMAVATHLARELAGRERRRWTYRFLFIPGTIGSITWLALNPEAAARIGAGLVAANLGDPGDFHYKRSRRGTATIDRIVESELEASGLPFATENFVPYGYDERQYGSPGFDLAVGSLTRTPYGRYPEYHTSADDLDFVRDDALAGSLALYLAVVDRLEAESELDAGPAPRLRPAAESGSGTAERVLVSTNPRCEPQLGKRGLYGSLGGSDSGRDEQMALLWVLNLADGGHTLADMARRSELPLEAVESAAGRLEAAGLLRDLGAAEP